jgi:pyruvate dehydrogenase E1 component beta subunit
MVLRTQGEPATGLPPALPNLEALFLPHPRAQGGHARLPSTPAPAQGRHHDDDPVIFIEHKLLYDPGPIPDDEYVIPLGKADIKKPGRDATIITYSYMTLKCLEAAAALESEGISVEVVDLRTLTPLDKETIIASVRRTGRAMVVHEACKRGGVGGDIAAMLMEEAYDDLDGPVVRVAGKNTPVPYNVRIEQACVPSVEDIVEGGSAAKTTQVRVRGSEIYAAGAMVLAISARRLVPAAVGFGPMVSGLVPCHWATG